MKENIYDNNLFFVCSLIEYIARKTKNKKEYIVKKIGKEKIQKIYELSDVYHSENIDKVSEEIINECNIENHDYDILSNLNNTNPPTFWDIGNVYKKLIINLSKSKEEYIDKLIEVLTSWIIVKIDNYDSNLYYENPKYILECYKSNIIL